ncbi:MAG: alpha-1,2-fucosyltransferase [Bacteroidales bacterium]|nr:alpha-1,2-fucosyltransferase [Bacteroidales bacterium]
MNKKIYVIIKGRSGNQLFQYAFARSIQETIGGELILDFSEMGFNKSKGKYGPRVRKDNVLDYFYVKPYTYVDSGTPYHKNLVQKFQFLIYRILRKVYLRFPNRIEGIASHTSGILQRMGIYYQFGTNSFLGFRKPSKSLNNILIRGWFESTSYFEPIKDLIKKELVISVPFSCPLESLNNKLLNEESVCIHVRRGDFLSEPYKNEFHICDLDYYRRGISLIEARYGNLLFFVCSDDIEWCKEHLFKNSSNVIYEPSGITISDTIHLMTSCHHFVISNSTMSFWMQYLSNHPDKMVVAPSVWRRCDPPIKDIYMKEWTLIDCK